MKCTCAPSLQSESLAVSIADVLLKIKLPAGKFALGANFAPYVVSTERGNDVNIRLHCRVESPGFATDHLNFQAADSIQTRFLERTCCYIFRRKRELLLATKSFSVCRNWNSSVDYLSEQNPVLGSSGWPLLAVWGYLSLSGQGLLLHGSFVQVQGKSFLLLGHSGAGKSTLSRFVTEEGGICLTDENPFVRIVAGEPRVYGSPWYSCYDVARTKIQDGEENSAHLDGVFILHHAPRNTLSLYAKAEAGRALLNHTRTFNWVPETIPAAFDILDKLIKCTNVYSFGFVPDKSAVHCLLDAVESS